MKLLSGLLTLACVPAVLAANNAPLPKDNVAEFVAQKLDVTTLPSSIRPKSEKSKKTFADYGYALQQIDEKQKLVEATPEGSQIYIRILEQSDSGIYVCIKSPGQTANNGPIQRVLLLKLKNADGLLKARESWKEFSGCPVLGGDGPDSSAGSYGG
ncbi:MAG TPA: hypothetical protein VNU23_05580 [Candidatus Cybelea sp.]|jgi:hypothetical protein|nr:hypothetical protein [Candidatus Cybelea sp.]